MYLHRIGLLLTSFALVIYVLGRPIMLVGGPFASLAHALIGLLLGTGVTLMIGAAIMTRRGC